MAIEIERKYLIKNDSWRDFVSSKVEIQQAYLNRDDTFSVRVRVQNETANINIKSNTSGAKRDEYEYPIPWLDAQEILSKLPQKIHKKRHLVTQAKHTWEIDEFYGDNSGLVIAEIELDAEDEKFVIPDWCGLDLSNDKRFYNASLINMPYKYWVTHIDVLPDAQTLYAFNPLGECVFEYLISTAKNGLGETKNSNCTPRGLHTIRAKIGESCPINTVFVSRRPTGEIWSSNLHSDNPERDWVLSRILWLSGCEKSKNRLGNVDSMQRYIYIHGTPSSEPLGQPYSHGCIRMRNEDVIELFEHCFIGTTVMIHE